MKPPLTKTQQEIYRFIKRFWEVELRNPTLRDISTGTINGEQFVKSRTRAPVWSAIQRLKRKGYLEEHYWNNVPYWVPSDEA